MLITKKLLTHEASYKSYASARSSSAADPFSKPISKPWLASGDRHLGSSSDTDDVLLVSLRGLSFLSPLSHAARNTTPAGTSPVVTRRHKAISNLRARATIIVLRFLPPQFESDTTGPIAGAGFFHHRPS